ncbi:hypothetical protein HMPREF1869_00573 [Bacteroidales bacterium KA00251]|nr:hypothetical protein HMPREF1869_00573 [Bacteroidales bacterium KA00251]
MASKNLKLYYSAKEVAEMLEEDISTIYYWEKKYDLNLSMSKVSSKRRYRLSDIELMRKIKHLVRDKKLTSEGVQQALSLENQEVLDQRAKAMLHLKQSLATVESMIRQMDAYRLKSQKRQLPETPILLSTKKNLLQE